MSSHPSVVTGRPSHHSLLLFFFLMIRRPPRSTLFPYTDALPIYKQADKSTKFYGSVFSAFSTSHRRRDRKSTRLNSSHDQISYAVFCLKKKTRATALRPCLHLREPESRLASCDCVTNAREPSAAS